MTRFEQQVKFLVEIDKVKNIFRHYSLNVRLVSVIESIIARDSK